jgi:hypothetical protein
MSCIVLSQEAVQNALEVDESLKRKRDQFFEMGSGTSLATLLVADYITILREAIKSL